MGPNTTLHVIYPIRKCLVVTGPEKLEVPDVQVTSVRCATFREEYRLNIIFTEISGNCFVQASVAISRRIRKHHELSKSENSLLHGHVNQRYGIGFSNKHICIELYEVANFVGKDYPKILIRECMAPS